MSQGTVRGNRRQKSQNVSSLLLNDSENNSLFGALGRGCVTLATGVVQLYTADAPTRQRWSKRHTGVVCFIKDNPLRSYFIRVYDIKKSSVIWQQEIYNQFRYKAPREYFHTFEADDFQAGLNFASEDEAFKFKNAVEQKLLERHQRRMEKKKNQQSVRRPAKSPPNINSNTGPSAGQPMTNSEINLSKTAPGGTLPKNKSKSKDKGKKKLTKEDISTPTDFRHVSHVGWDPNKGFDMNNLDPAMRDVFQSVGIDENDAVDEETVDFIYEFVNQHGGIDAVKAEMASRPPPSVPETNKPRHQQAPPPPSRRDVGPPQRTNAPPPPPPNRGGPPFKTPGAPPPPPPPSAGHQPPPPPPPSNKPPPMAPPQPPVGVPTPPAHRPPAAPVGGPPPPPPPPPPAAPAAPPPPPIGGPAMPTPPSGGAGRGALLDQIRGGAALNKVTTNDRPAGDGDARGSLLSAIRSGTSLKHVEQTEEKGPQEPTGGIVGALARALANRQKHIQGSDSESDDDDDDVSDDDDWDD